MRVKGEKLSEQRVLFLGAGSAATGIAHLIADAMAEEGLPREEALKRIALVDSKGMVSSRRSDTLAANKLPFAHDLPLAGNLLEAVKVFKPTAIIGVSAQPKTFTKEVIEEMSALNERPIIFALSNPTSKACLLYTSPRPNARPRKRISGRKAARSSLPVRLLLR